MSKTANIKFWIAIVFAVWFSIAGMVWVYWAALVIAYPFGIASAIIWALNKSKPEETKRYKILGYILLGGLLLSLGMLVGLLATN